MLLEDLNGILSQNELEELSQNRYNDETSIDEAIERVKEIDSDIERLKELHKAKVDKINFEFESKLEKLNKKRGYETWNIKNAVLLSDDKKETKTQYKKQYLSGDVVIKKAKEDFVKPKLTDEEIKSKLPDYAKTKEVTDLDWANLKKSLVNANGRIVNTATGEDLSDIITVSFKDEEIVIK